MEIFYTILMTTNIICGVAIMLTGLQKHKTHYLTLAILNVFAFFYYYFSWQLHTALSLSHALEMSRYQTMVMILGAPLILFTFGRWCKSKYTNQLVGFLAIIAIPLVAINLFDTYSIRYSSVEQLIQYKSLFGENLAIIKGTANPWFLLVHFILIFNLLLLIKFAIRFAKQKKNIISFSLIIMLLIQLGCAYIGIKIDQGQLNLFYVAAMPITVFSVVCLLLISTMFKVTNTKLIAKENQKIKMDIAISALARETSNVNNGSFYNKATLNIQELFSTKYAFIGLYFKSPAGGRIETLSLVDSGKTLPNISYDLAATPCENVVGKDTCIYENDVDKLFPKDLLLSEMGVKSYIGFPIFSNEHQTLGILVLLHDQPLHIDQDLQSMLPVFGSRIGAELSRDKLANKLKQIAYYDYTTQLPNRASLFDKINHLYQQNAHTKSNSLLILLDIDNFKEINNTFGYKTADNLLKEIGHRLKTYAGEHIFIARVGGDEFAIVMEQLKYDMKSLIDVQWQAISAIIKKPIRLNDQDIFLECSAGNVVFPLQTNDKLSVIRFAESALQQAKSKGKNQYAIFDKDIEDALERKQLVLHEIQAAIKANQQLFMVYQPQTDKDGKLLGAEALIRWVSPVYGFISPGEFIPVVEQTELINDLGNWVIETVFKQMLAWQSQNIDLPEHICINVASKQLLNHDFIDNVINLSKQYRITPSNVVLELTESGILTDRSLAIERLKQLREYGFVVAMDDFGTGYSSLSYLKDLPIDILKIDKSFIDDISSPSTYRLIQSMFSIGKHLNLNIIAEGTETKEQISALENLGCTCFQGYYFSKPLEVEQFITWKYEEQ